jgi:hypothetical protein
MVKVYLPYKIYFSVYSVYSILLLYIRMDTNNSLITAGITSGIIAVIGAIYKICHHCRFRSSCCGKEIKVDSNLSPPDNKQSFDISKKEIISV